MSLLGGVDICPALLDVVYAQETGASDETARLVVVNAFIKRQTIGHEESLARLHDVDRW
jgi:hypothetical protein